MSTRYIDGGTLDEAREAHRQGVSIDRLAEKLGIEPDDLRRRLGLKPSTPAAAEADFDLWRVDELRGQL